MMPKRVCLLAAALMLVSGAATAHSWYSEQCCHDKDCHPVRCQEIEKISDGWLWHDKATKRRHWFRTIDCTRRAMTPATFTFRH
jgi:hypothetical protein